MNAFCHRNGFVGCSIVLMAALLVLPAGGCGTILGEPASDPGGTGSIFRISIIEPFYFDAISYQVDLILDNCETDPANPADPEPWTDHFASVTFTNEHLPNAEVATASNIYLYRYELSFSPHNLDGQAANIGAMNSPIVVPLNQTLTIVPCDLGVACAGTTYSAVFMMPVESKVELVALYAAAGFTNATTGLPQTEYCVEYTFYGENAFGVAVTVSESTCFLATNYDYCD